MAVRVRDGPGAGLLRGMARQQSWAGAGMLGVIRALIRDDDLAFLGPGTGTCRTCGTTP